jgi:hypothetical protein
MKTSVVKFFAGSGIRLAVLSLLFLGLAGVCMAQASAAPARPATPAAVAPQAQPAAQPGQTAPSSKPAAKGTHEGIKVHGHWTIEVRNPDGTLVTHREFENSLTPFGNGGAQLLAALLSRTLTTGGWAVFLTNGGGGQITIAEAGSTGAAQCATLASDFPTAVGCSTNLSVTPQLTLSGGQLSGTGTLTFGGSAVVFQGFPSVINQVTTQNFACSISSSPAACTTTTADLGSLNGFALTYRMLDGQNGDPAAVPVSVGQTVAVTVVISFM